MEDQIVDVEVSFTVVQEAETNAEARAEVAQGTKELIDELDRIGGCAVGTSEGEL